MTAVSQQKRGREIKQLGGRKRGGSDQTQECSKKRNIFVNGLQQYIKDQRQADITTCFDQVSGETQAEHVVRNLEVLDRCSGIIGRDEFRWNVGLAEATTNEREQHQHSRDLCVRPY